MVNNRDGYLPNIPIVNKSAKFLLVLLFAVIATCASPFVYDDANSGRYLLKVIKAADPELYVNDPVADSLQEFDSAFYNLLALVFRITPVGPQTVEPVMFVLYIIYQIVLFAVLYLLAQTLTGDIRFYFLIAIFALHPEPLPVSGTALFVNSLRHTELAYLLCLIALLSLFVERRYFLFWACISLALLVHALVALQFLIIVMPGYLIWHRPDRQAYRPHLGGILLFGAALVYYFLSMSPPAMSAEEGWLFLQMKGQMSHISPFNQSYFGWLTLIAVAGVTLLTWWFNYKQDKNSRQLVMFTLWGIISALTLSMLAISTASVRLALFQPMRIFYWVWFFTYLLLLWQTFQQLKAGSLLGIILLAAVLLFLLESLYAMVILGLCVVYILSRAYLPRARPELLPGLERWTLLGLVSMIGVVLVGWLAGQILGNDSFFLQNLWPVPVLALLGFIAVDRGRNIKIRRFYWAALLILAVTAVSLYWHDVVTQKLDPDWKIVQLWTRDHTAKNDHFITTPDVGGNFRTGSFRTTVTEPMSALFWVEPYLAQENGAYVRAVKAALVDGIWLLPDLFELAQHWGASYIIIRGAYAPEIQPVFQSGEISVFAVEAATTGNGTSYIAGISMLSKSS